MNVRYTNEERRSINDSIVIANVIRNTSKELGYGDIDTEVYAIRDGIIKRGVIESIEMGIRFDGKVYLTYDAKCSFEQEGVFGFHYRSTDIIDGTVFFSFEEARAKLLEGLE